MDIRWLVRAYRWVRNPPSPRLVAVVFAVVAVALAVAAIEHWLGWPGALTLPDGPRWRAPR